MLRTECQFHEKSFKISHWFQINLVYQSERKVGEILFRILLSSLSVLVFRLQISHLQWARDSSNKPVSQCVSEFAFMEFWASRPLLANQIILRTGASEFWNVSVFFFLSKMCAYNLSNFVQPLSQQTQGIGKVSDFHVSWQLSSHEMLVWKKGDFSLLNIYGFDRSVYENKVLSLCLILLLDLITKFTISQQAWVSDFR